LKVKRNILRVAIWLLLAVFCTLTLLYLGQRKLLFPAPNYDLPGNLPAYVERIELSDGYGLLLTPDTKSKAKMPLLIYAHGNAEVAFWSINAFDELLNRGIAVLLLEYPGYGGAEGSPNYESIRNAALSAYDEAVKRREFDPEKIIVYGRSIGGGAAALIASQRKVAVLCLESSFSSLTSLVREKGYPSFLLLDRFDNTAIVKNLDIPIFLYHGVRDVVIPIEHSKLLALSARKVEFVQAECGHNNCVRPWPRLLEFLEENLVNL
jgi:pimeloyl-ACP methyl ester carboxylesterase